MARHLCIVARDNSPLYGFLTIAFRERPADADTLDVVLDRRRGDAVPDRGRPAPPSDRRRHVRVQEALQTRGYAIIAGPGGAPRASDEAFIERAVGVLADVERRGPLALRFPRQRRTVGRAMVRTAIGAGIVLAIIWGLATLPKIGGLARVTDDLGRWTDAAVGGLEQTWTTLSGGTVPPSTARASEGEGRRPPQQAPSPAPATITSTSHPATAEPERAPGAASSSASLRPAPVPEARLAPELPRVAERIPAPLVAVRPPAPQASDTDIPSLVTFSGLPRVELSRQPSSSGSGIVYTVHLVDPGGRPVPGAQVWMRGHSADGQARDTRLDAVDPPGTYRSGPLPLGALPPQLSVRVFFSNMRIEVPIEP